MGDESKLIVPLPGGEEKEFDLTNPDDIKKLGEQASKGYGFEKGQTELKSLKDAKEKADEQLTYWQNLVEHAKDSGDPAQVVAALKMVGVDLKTETDDNITEQDVDSAVNSKIDDLNTKIDKLETALYSRVTDDEHKALESKYDDYNRKAVEEFAKNRGIMRFEDAYLIMNQDSLAKRKYEQEEKKRLELEKKQAKVGQKPKKGGGLEPTKPKVSGNYDKVTHDWLEDLKSGAADNPFEEE